MAWAIVTNNVVENIVVSLTGEGYALIPDGIGIGWRLVDAVWVEPEPVKQRDLTALDFWQRLTPAERIAVLGSSDPVTKDLVAMMELVTAYDVISLDSANLQTGIGYLELTGLIAPGRAAEILA